MPDDVDPPGPILDDAEPSAERVQTARRLMELHRRVFVPEPTCNWCLKRWPCDDAGWALRVLRRGELERGIQH